MQSLPSLPEFEKTSLGRRKFLGLMVGVAGLALFPFGCGGSVGPLPFVPTVLSPVEAQTLLTLRKVALSGGELKKESGSEKWFLTEVEEFLKLNPPHLVLDLKLALAMVRRAPLWAFSLRPLEQVSLPKARQGFKRLLASRILGPRQAAEGCLQLILFVHYSHPATWGAMGYEGTWVKR